MKVVNSLNFNYLDYPGEVNNLPSETVPDQAMSVREILQRYARGLPLTEAGRVPIWAESPEDDDLPDIKTLDLAERQEIKEAAEAELLTIKKRQNAKNKPKQQVASSVAKPTQPKVEGNDETVKL